MEHKISIAMDSECFQTWKLDTVRSVSKGLLLSVIATDKSRLETLNQNTIGTFYSVDPQRLFKKFHNSVSAFLGGIFWRKNPSQYFHLKSFCSDDFCLFGTYHFDL